MKMMQQPAETRNSCRETWAEVSLGAISHNVKLFKLQMKPSCRFMAVVKANGYGHGAVEAAKAALAAGADYLGVAIVDEALQLRKAGIHHPILVLGHTPLYAVKTALRHRIALTVFSEQVLDEAISCAEQLRQPARIHLKIDTGMTRLGVTGHEAALALARKAQSSPHVTLEGAFSHFADADGSDPSYTLRQYRLFASYIDFLRRHHIEIPLKHICNSAAAMRFPDMHLDMVRVGIALYGLSPLPGSPLPGFPLIPAMQLKTKISAVKRVPSGQPVGYGCTYITQSDRITATLPIGYADGLPRRLSNRGSALVRDQRVPIAGNICMDQTILDVTPVPCVEAGEEAVLIGGTKENFITMDEIASQAGTIHYEVACLIGSRVPRIYT
ncbi:alanine racemase [Paenibacillus hamazuiensis]|uniref:alanine racemase n=1 Tax=Paenibacillus hamazuiensis TaxID=2936508 RepID=UPI00200F6E76|nr:alanine racemase [Paenibacillus hamazuiensis]